MNDIDLILEQLRAEMSVLKKELDKCLADLDYENAHLFQNTIRIKSLEISAIERRVQQNYQEISTCKMKIKLNRHRNKKLEDSINQNAENKEIRERILLSIEELKQKLNKHLDELIELKRTNTPFQVDSDILIQQIEQFLVSESKMICLEIIDAKVLNYISIEKEETELVIKYVNSAVSEGMRKVPFYLRNSMYQLGFKLDDSFVWTHILDKSDVDANKIMILIASVIFEVVIPSKKAKCKLMV